MTKEVSLRRATPADLAAVARLLQRMVEEMAAFGRDALRVEPARSEELERIAREDLASADALVVIAGAEAGLLVARVAAPDAVYAPKRLLHVSAVWVEPGQRRRGLGRRLVEEALVWGRSCGCTEARLNVLAANPASSLYRALGFEDVQLEMRRTIEDGSP